MANSKSSKKRARQAIKNRTHNMSLRSAMRTTIKKTNKAIESADKPAAQAAYVDMQKTLDRYADKGLLHKNKVARYKSRLNTKIKAMA